MKLNKKLILEYMDATRKNHPGMTINVDHRLLKKENDILEKKDGSIIPAAAGIGALVATAYTLT
jgi:hypothetical protein